MQNVMRTIFDQLCFAFLRRGWETGKEPNTCLDTCQILLIIWKKYIFICLKIDSSPTANNHLKFDLTFGCLTFRLFSSFPPPFKIPSFMFLLRVITAKCVMLRCKV